MMLLSNLTKLINMSGLHSKHIQTKKFMFYIWAVLKIYTHQKIHCQ